MSGAFVYSLSSLERKHRALYLVSILCTLTTFLSLVPNWQKKIPVKILAVKWEFENQPVNLLFETARQSFDIALAVLDQEKVWFLLLKSANLTGVRGRRPLKKIITEDKSIRWFPNEPRLLILLPLSNKKGKAVHYTLGQW